MVTSFARMPIEYWGLIHRSPALSLSIPFFQPGYVSTSSRQGMWPLAVPLGSVMMVEVDRFPRNLVVGGPAAPDRRIYLLLQTRDRAAAVRVRGLGQVRRVELPPYSAEVVPLCRSQWRPNWSEYDVVTVEAEKQKYVNEIPCYAQALISPEMVSCQLIQNGFQW